MVKDSLLSANAQPAKPRQEQGRSSVALSAAGMGEFEWNPVTDRFIVSDRMSAITGIPGGSMRAHGGRAALDYIYPDDISALETQYDTVMAEADRYEVRFRLIRPDFGELMWVSLSAVLIRNPHGAVEKVIGVVRDISGRKAEEDERDSLISELDHRVKNVLDSVQSFASQSARRTATFDTFFRTFSERIRAMAAAHTLLTAMRRRGADIEMIAAAELAGLSFGRAVWGGAGITLNARATNVLTLALHELATNSVKFGALSTENGHVDVVWRSSADGGFALTWTESHGPTVKPPTHRGFGLGLLENVTSRELGGLVHLAFNPEGLVATLTANADAVTEIAEETTPAPPTTTSAALGANPPDSEKRDIPLVGKISLAGIRILIVEDSVLLTQELKKGLKALRAKVIGTAGCVEEAERYLKADFDVAVVDSNLNGQSVAPICRALFDRDIPFVVTVGGDDAASAPKGFNAQIVRKPYTLEQLGAAISRSGVRRT